MLPLHRSYVCINVCEHQHQYQEVAHGGELRGREVEEGRQRGQLAEDLVAVHRVHVLLVLRGEALLLPMERGHKLNLFIGNRLNDTPTYIWTYN